MAPFRSAQLVLSEIVYDGALAAMRARLFGVRAGLVDVLIVGNKTYLLVPDGDEDRCEELGDTGWTPLPRDWLAPGAQCVGSAPISETSVHWWKTPIQPSPLTDWMWFKASDQSPFRLLFEKPTDRLSVLSSYALSYQVKFAALSESGLADAVASCQRAKPTTRRSARTTLRTLLDAMERSHTRASADIKRLFPELDRGCPTAARPVWPEALGMTMFLTPLNFHANPLPTEVLYNWKARSQRTRMFYPADSPIVDEDALMRAQHGYSVTRKRGGDVECLAPLPGTPRPDWISEAPCVCEAVINGVTSLTPYGAVQILRCPATKPRLFWTWHTFEGRPMVLLVTPSTGEEPSALITLADYYAWLSGYASDEAAFARPAKCASLDVGRQAKSGQGGLRSAEPCGRCHLTPDAAQRGVNRAPAERH